MWGLASYARVHNLLDDGCLPWIGGGLCSPPVGSNFMLYPKEDEEHESGKPQLVYYCKNCNSEPIVSADPYVFRNQVIKTRT